MDKVEHQWIGATCTNAKICTMCEIVEGDALGHKLVIDYGYDAICTQTGLTDGAHCEVCNEIIIAQEEIPALSLDLKHNEYIVPSVDSTCDEYGYTEKIYCLDCKKVIKESVEIEPKGHKWVEATYTSPKTCSVCNKVEGSNLPCPGHVDSNKDSLCDVCTIRFNFTSTSKWIPNKQTNGWNGQGMTVKILVSSIENSDPFNSEYDKSDKKVMQKHIRSVEAAYGINIEFVEWEASWGPDRIEYIKARNFDEDIYIANINSSWIQTLVKAGCLAELAALNSHNEAVSGIFTEIGLEETSEGSGVYKQATYLQDPINNEATSSLNKVYGYVQGNVRPDYFMYYNADLIASANMVDPAELWLKGEWTWSNFKQYCEQLQAKLPQTNYALSVGFAELVIGSVASTGGKIATSRPSLGLTSLTVIERFKEIQSLYASGCYENRNIEDVSIGFLEKRVAFVHGNLWFLNEPSRFNPEQCDFTIGAVPYPTADENGGKPILTTDVNEAIIGYDGEPIEINTDSGEYISGVDMSDSSFAVPYTSTECYSIIDTVTGKNGINNKIIFAILYDLYEGLGYDEEEGQIDEDIAYYNWLLTKFDRSLYADVIMSVQDCTYSELIEVVSMSVSGGSRFGYNSFWTLAANICKNSSVNPATRLNEVVDEYEDAMMSMGYNL